MITLARISSQAAPIPVQQPEGQPMVFLQRSPKRPTTFPLKPKEQPQRYSRGPDRKRREGIIAGKHLKFGVLPKEWVLFFRLAKRGRRCWDEGRHYK